MQYNINKTVYFDVSCRYCKAQRGDSCVTNTFSECPKPHQKRFEDYFVKKNKKEK